MKASQFFILSFLGFAEATYTWRATFDETNEFPKGMLFDTIGNKLHLSNLMASPSYLYYGGRTSSLNSYKRGTDPHENADGIAFLNQLQFNGMQRWIKYYNTPSSSVILNVAWVSSIGQVFAHFDGGLVAMMSESDGSI